MSNIIQLSDYRKQDIYLDPVTYPQPRYEGILFFWSTACVAMALGWLAASKLVLGGR